MSDKIEKKYLVEKRRKNYGGTKNDALYLCRQSQQIVAPPKRKVTLSPLDPLSRPSLARAWPGKKVGDPSFIAWRRRKDRGGGDGILDLGELRFLWFSDNLHKPKGPGGG